MDLGFWNFLRDLQEFCAVNPRDRKLHSANGGPERVQSATSTSPLIQEKPRFNEGPAWFGDVDSTGTAVAGSALRSSEQKEWNADG